VFRFKFIRQYGIPASRRAHSATAMATRSAHASRLEAAAETLQVLSRTSCATAIVPDIVASVQNQEEPLMEPEEHQEDDASVIDEGEDAEVVPELPAGAGGGNVEIRKVVPLDVRLQGAKGVRSTAKIMKIGLNIVSGSAQDYPVGPFQLHSDVKKSAIEWGNKHGWRLSLTFYAEATGIRGTRIRVRCDQRKQARKEDRMKVVTSKLGESLAPVPCTRTWRGTGCAFRVDFEYSVDKEWVAIHANFIHNHDAEPLYKNSILQLKKKRKKRKHSQGE